MAPHANNPDRDQSVDLMIDLTRILTAWSLRIDGWKYVREHGFEHVAAIDRYEKTECLPSEPMQQLVMLFMLQRWLCKWGGESEELTSPAWQAATRLFELTVDVDPPAVYRFSPWYEEWDVNWRNRRTECLLLVRTAMRT